MSSPLSADLAQVTDLVSFLVVPIDPVGEEWVACDALIEDPGVLRELVDSTGAGRGTSDPAVAASLFTQSYAYRLASATLAPFVLTGRVAAATPQHTSIRIGRFRPAGIAIRTPVAMAGLTSDIQMSSVEGEKFVCETQPELITWLCEQLFANHLDAFVASIRETVKVGERLLWGNVSASFVSVLRTVEGALVDREQKLRVRTFADRFVALSPHDFSELGNSFVLQSGRLDGWFHERTTCCLWYKSGEAQKNPESVAYCADCSLTATNERRATLLAELAALAEQADRADSEHSS